jgi:hypothetical protein
MVPFRISSRPGKINLYCLEMNTLVEMIKAKKLSYHVGRERRGCWSGSCVLFLN